MSDGAAGDITSRPFFVREAPLQSLHAQQVFGRVYEMVANSLFSLSIILRVIGTGEQAAGVEEIVDDRIKKVHDDLLAEKARLDKLAEENGISLQTVAYTRPQTVAARITSPKAMRYLATIQEFDDLVGRFDVLWLSGIIADAAYSDAVYAWKRRLFKLSNGIRSIAREAMAAARRTEQAQTAVDGAPVASDALDTAEAMLAAHPEEGEDDVEETTLALTASA